MEAHLYIYIAAVVSLSRLPGGNVRPIVRTAGGTSDLWPSRRVSRDRCPSPYEGGRGGGRGRDVKFTADAT